MTARKKPTTARKAAKPIIMWAFTSKRGVVFAETVRRTKGAVLCLLKGKPMPSHWRLDRVSVEVRR